MKKPYEQKKRDAIHTALCAWASCDNGTRVQEVERQDVEHASLVTGLGIITAYEHDEGGVTVMAETREHATFVGMRPPEFEPLRLFIITEGTVIERTQRYQALPTALLHALNLEGIAPRAARNFPDVGNE